MRKIVPAEHDWDATDASGTRVSRRGLRLSLPLALGLLVFLLGLVTPGRRLDDPDAMLHVAIGHWIVAHHAVPHVDIFTHSMPGQMWVAHEWLAGIVSALCYDALGWHGLVAMASLGLGIAIAIFARTLLRYYTPVQTIVIACAAWVVVTPHWLARPHIVALPFLVLWMALLVRARQEERAPPLGAALLMIPWVNLHGTFLVGIGFSGLLTVEAVIATAGEAAPLKAASGWAIFTLAAMLASLVTPYGVEAYLLPLRLLDMKFALSMLTEWKSIDFQTLSPLELWLLLFIGGALIRGIRLPVTRVLLILLLFTMSLQHSRNGDLIAFLAPLLAGPWAGPQLRRARASMADDWLARSARPASASGLGIAGLVGGACVAIALAFPLGPAERYAPAAAIRAVVAANTGSPVLNDYNFGDYLIFAGIKTFIDGRADMFGDPFIKRDYEATHALNADLPRLLDQYHIGWTIFPANSPALAELDRLPGWRRFYADAIAVVHVRDGTPP
jgi:hypothetical protein